MSFRNVVRRVSKPQNCERASRVLCKLLAFFILVCGERMSLRATENHKHLKLTKMKLNPVLPDQTFLNLRVL